MVILYVLKKQLIDYLISHFSKILSDKELEIFTGDITPVLDEVFVSPRTLLNFSRIIQNDYFINSYAENLPLLKFYVEVIIMISAFSNYLTDIVVRNPEFLSRFIGSGELYTDFNEPIFEKELDSTTNAFRTFNKKIDAIKRFKRLHTLRIGLRDILNLTNIENTMFEYSLLTSSILDRVFKLVINSIKENKPDREIPEYCLVSLGKLGGLELNFSSDVDLMCFYDDNENKPENLELFYTIVKKFIDVCSNPTNEGYLYRVDFRLRPDGKYSPLARSMTYYQIYYESYGSDWEKQMLLKMNFVSGSKVLFERFQKFVHSFIFHGVFFDSPKVFVKRFRNIYQNIITADSTDDKMNIKHFSGGIRDVEFSIQVLQLLNGKKINDLRTPNTINAIKQLARYKLISEKESKRLIDSYKFLRRVENFIQLMDDRQIHALPKDNEKIVNLTRFLGLRKSKQFYSQLEFTRKIIKNFAANIFESEDIKQFEINRYIDPSKVKNPESIKKHFQLTLNILRDNLSDLDDSTLEEFQKEILRRINISSNPEIFTKNFYRFISSIKTKVQIKELLTNKGLLELTLLISELSEHLMTSLISSQRLIDLYFSGRLFSRDFTEIDFQNLDEEQIRIFILQITLNFLLKNFDSQEVNFLLTNFVDSTFENLTQEITIKYKLEKEAYSIIALGSYGTKEMHLKSDIDILFVFDSEIDQAKAEKFSLNILSSFRDKFKLFDFFQADSKIRPEGKASKLSWQIDEMKNYINSRMRIWEFQSYTKMRLVDGSEKIFNTLLESVRSKVIELKSDYIANEIKKNKTLIRQNKIHAGRDFLDLKNSTGGLLDLQFTQQYLTLINKTNFQNFIARSFIQFCSDYSRFNKNYRTRLEQLSRNFYQIFTFILLNQIITGTKGHILSRNFNSKFVNQFLNISNTTKIFDYLKSLLDENYRLIKEISPEINK